MRLQDWDLLIPITKHLRVLITFCRCLSNIQSWRFRAEWENSHSKSYVNDTSISHIFFIIIIPISKRSKTIKFHVKSLKLFMCFIELEFLKLLFYSNTFEKQKSEQWIFTNIFELKHVFTMTFMNFFNICYFPSIYWMPFIYILLLYSNFRCLPSRKKLKT